jgi:hypothetical protein
LAKQKPAEHGGKRTGAGRKPKQPEEFVEEFTERVKDVAARLAEKYGKPIEEAALEMIYDDEVQASVKASVWKSWCEFHKKPASKDSTIKLEVTKPAIGLPPLKEE